MPESKRVGGVLENLKFTLKTSEKKGKTIATRGSGPGHGGDVRA